MLIEAVGMNVASRVNRHEPDWNGNTFGGTSVLYHRRAVFASHRMSTVRVRVQYSRRRFPVHPMDGCGNGELLMDFSVPWTQSCCPHLISSHVSARSQTLHDRSATDCGPLKPVDILTMSGHLNCLRRFSSVLLPVVPKTALPCHESLYGTTGHSSHPPTVLSNFVRRCGLWANSHQSTSRASTRRRE